jgi:hypothetical protein
MDMSMLQRMDLAALERKAREKAKAEAERMWPPGMQYSQQRQRTEDDLAIEYYRQYTGADQ